MNREELITICERLSACDESTAWLGSLTCETARECWDTCERGDWMVWLLTKRPGVVMDRTLRLIAVDFARAVQPIADSWFAQHAPQHVGAGVRLLDLIESDPDADPHTWATAYGTARDAARAARDAARAASDAAMAAMAARDAAWAAEWASSDAASDAASDAMAAMDAARDAAWADQAQIVRARVSWAEVESGLRGVA